MPRSKIVTLPRPVRERLDAMLIERGFSGYQELANWLAEQGHFVSHMSVYRYGTKLEKRLDRTRVATQQAEALASALPDDRGAMSDVTLRMAQEALFNLMMAIGDGDEPADPKLLSSAIRSLTDMARASTTLRAERRRTLASAGRRAEKAAVKAGLSAATIARLRKEVEGDEDDDGEPAENDAEASA